MHEMANNVQKNFPVIVHPNQIFHEAALQQMKQELPIIYYNKQDYGRWINSDT